MLPPLLENHRKTSHNRIITYPMSLRAQFESTLAWESTELLHDHAEITLETIVARLEEHGRWLISAQAQRKRRKHLLVVQRRRHLQVVQARLAY